MNGKVYEIDEIGVHGIDAIMISTKASSKASSGSQFSRASDTRTRTSDIEIINQRA